MKLCAVIDPDSGSKCDELEGHARIEGNGRKFDHFSHVNEHGWNEPPRGRTWDDELTEALPPYACIVPQEIEAGDWYRNAEGWQRIDVIQSYRAGTRGVIVTGTPGGSAGFRRPGQVNGERKS